MTSRPSLWGPMWFLDVRLLGLMVMLEVMLEMMLEVMLNVMLEVTLWS